jgi:CHAP domain
MMLGRPRRKALWLWLIAAFGSTGLVLVAIFGLVVAVVGASFGGCQPATEAALPSTGPTPSAYARQSIPPERLRLYEQAGAKFNIDWSFLASIGAQECGNGDCAGTNSSGCAGPMQIAYERGSACSPDSGPTLWEKYEVSAHPGKAPSVNDPADAIYTAARILREDKGAPATGGSFAEYHQAACNYFGACGEGTIAYAEEVMARAVQYGFTGNGSPAATSPPLAEPVSTGGCEASTFSPEAASSTQIVKVAESQIGTGESPEGSNCTKYGPCEEWCSLLVAWVWQHAGVPLPGATATYGYSGALYTWVREHGGRVLGATATPVPGDLAFYGNGPAESEHVGVVTRVDRNGRITTIDGNYANHVTVVGPFKPADATNAGQSYPIYGYARPPAAKGLKA